MAAVVIATAIANTNCLCTIRRVHFFLSLALSLARLSFFFFSKDIVEGASLFSIPLYYIQFSAGVCQTFSTIRNSCVGTVFHLSYMVDGIKERWCAYILFSLSLFLYLSRHSDIQTVTTQYMYICTRIFVPFFSRRVVGFIAFCFILFTLALKNVSLHCRSLISFGNAAHRHSYIQLLLFTSNCILSLSFFSFRFVVLVYRTIYYFFTWYPNSK